MELITASSVSQHNALRALMTKSYEKVQVKAAHTFRNFCWLKSNKSLIKTAEILQSHISLISDYELPWIIVISS